MKLPLPISTLLAYHKATTHDLHDDADIGIDKHQRELYYSFYAPQFDFVDCYSVDDADNEWQPFRTVVKKISTGKFYSIVWLKYVSYSYLHPKCGEEWHEVEAKEKTVIYYVEKQNERR
jgi:hypothetical protein